MDTHDPQRFQELFQEPEGQSQPVIIRGVDIHKIYRSGPQETHALRGATLDVYRGEYLSIMGP